MGQESLVDRHLAGGEKLLRQLQDDGFAYSAAAWVKDDRTSQWFLYIVTELVETSGKIAAYEKLNESRYKLADLSLDSFDFKLVSPNSTFGQSIRPYVAALGPAPLMAHSRSPKLGNELISETYIYPRSLQPAFDEWSEVSPNLTLANTASAYPASAG